MTPQPEEAVGGSDCSLSISVVIPTYRRGALLERVVRPHLADDVVLEVILVDDGSDDDTPAVLQRLAREHERVRVVRQDNAGPTAARAAGAEAARGDVLLLLDDDVAAGSGLARGHLEAHARLGPGAVVVGYMPPALPEPRRGGMYPVVIYARDYEATCRRYERDGATILTHLWGGNLSVRRSLFLEAQEPDADLPYHEDQVLGLRLRDLGGWGVFDRSLAATHIYTRSPAQFWRDCQRQGRAIARFSASGAGGGLGRMPCELSESTDDDGPASIRRVAAALAPPAAAPLRALVRGLIFACGRARVWALEERVARLLRHVEMARGAKAAGAGSR